MPTGCLRCSQYSDTKTDAVQYITFMHTRPDSTRVRQICLYWLQQAKRQAWLKNCGCKWWAVRLKGHWPPIVDEVWRRKRRRRRACSIIIHKGHGVRAEESDLYERKEWRKDNWQTIVSACVYTPSHTDTHTAVFLNASYEISASALCSYGTPPLAGMSVTLK